MIFCLIHFSLQYTKYNQMLRFAPVDLDIVIEHLTTFSNCPCQALPDVGTSHLYNFENKNMLVTISGTQ